MVWINQNRYANKSLPKEANQIERKEECKQQIDCVNDTGMLTLAPMRPSTCRESCRCSSGSSSLSRSSLSSDQLFKFHSSRHLNDI